MRGHAVRGKQSPHILPLVTFSPAAEKGHSDDLFSREHDKDE